MTKRLNCIKVCDDLFMGVFYLQRLIVILPCIARITLHHTVDNTFTSTRDWLCQQSQCRGLLDEKKCKGLKFHVIENEKNSAMFERHIKHEGYLLCCLTSGMRGLGHQDNYKEDEKLFNNTTCGLNEAY